MRQSALECAAECSIRQRHSAPRPTLLFSSLLLFYVILSLFRLYQGFILFIGIFLSLNQAVNNQAYLKALIINKQAEYIYSKNCESSLLWFLEPFYRTYQDQFNLMAFNLTYQTVILRPFVASFDPRLINSFSHPLWRFNKHLNRGLRIGVPIGALIQQENNRKSHVPRKRFALGFFLLCFHGVVIVPTRTKDQKPPSLNFCLSASTL